MFMNSCVNNLKLNLEKYAVSNIKIFINVNGDKFWIYKSVDGVDGVLSYDTKVFFILKHGQTF